MAANYATVAYNTVISGAPVFIEQGATRDTVTDAAVIATWAANWTATVPTATTAGYLLAGYLAAYPRGN